MACSRSILVVLTCILLPVGCNDTTRPQSPSKVGQGDVGIPTESRERDDVNNYETRDHTTSLEELFKAPLDPTSVSTVNRPRLVVNRYRLGRINSIECHPSNCDIILLATGFDALLIKLSTDELLCRFPHDDYVSSARFCSRKDTVVTGCQDGSMRLWDYSTGESVQKYDDFNADVSCLAVRASDDTIIATSSEGTVLVRRQGKIIFRARVEGTRDTGRAINGVRINAAAISTQGDYAATGDNDGNVILWNVSKGEKLATLQLEEDWPVDEIAFTPDGKWLVVADLASIAMISTSSRRIAWQLKHESASSTSALLPSPDSRHVYHVTLGGNVNKYEISSSNVNNRLSINETLHCASLSVDGEHLFAGCEDKLMNWDLMNGQEGMRHVSQSTNGDTVLGLSSDQLGGGIIYCTLAGQCWHVNLNTGIPTRVDVETGVKFTAVDFSPDGKSFVVGRSDGKLTRFDAKAHTIASSSASHVDSVGCVAFCPDGSSFVSGGLDGKVRFWDAADLRELTPPLEHDDEDQITSIAVSSDGKYLTENVRDTVSVWELGTKKLVEEFRPLHRFPLLNPVESRIGFDTSSKRVFSVGGSGIWVYDIEQPPYVKNARTIKYRNPTNRTVVSGACLNDRLLLAGHLHSAVLWDVEVGSPVFTFAEHTGMIYALDVDAGRKRGFTGDSDGTIRILDLETGRLVCWFRMDADGSGRTISHDGLIEASDPSRFAGVHWIFADDPFRPLPPEIFLRDYFEPSLLPRLLSGEKIPEPAGALGKLNRVQPEITDPAIRVKGDVAQVTIRVRAANNRDMFGVGERRREMITDAYDVRLLRDGQLVWQYPSPDNDPNRDLTIRTDAQLKAWRDAYHLVATRSDGWYETTVEVRLPHNHSAEKSARFEAYCFNEDRVKSRTAAIDVSLPAGLEPVRPKAYVICLGVNASQTRELDLRFAAADARDIGSRLSRALAVQALDVVPVTLISDYQGPRYSGSVVAQDATKENLRAVLSQLAGESVSAEARKRLPVETRNLPRSGPDDLVVLYAAGHGYTDPADGMFYLLPYDVGDHRDALRGDDAKAREAAFRAIFKRSISSSELSQWLRGVDAAQHVLVLDTCMSQGAVASAASEFKPGPFGSRGLGQLAYDKAMLVLAASQTDEFAVETDRGGLKHGLLTYTLLEGMQPADPEQPPRAAANGGILTMTGLLQYAVDQVPEVYKAAKEGQLEKRGFGAQSKTSVEPWADRAKAEIERRWPSLSGLGGAGAQRPVLFDYRRGRPDVNLSGNQGAADGRLGVDPPLPR